MVYFDVNNIMLLLITLPGPSRPSQKIGQEGITTSWKKNNQDGGLFFFILPVIISKHPVSKEIICLAHPIDTFHDRRRALSLRLIIHGSLQGDIPSKSINPDADSSQDIIVKELRLHLRRNQMICLFVLLFCGKKCR